VAFRFDAGRYWIGLPEAHAAPLTLGEPVKLLIDEGRWFFDLRGVWIGGHPALPDALPPGASPGLSWFELAPDKVVSWHYGTLREATRDGD
jgi:hypothetical protein